MFPELSAAGPVSDIQIAPARPFGTTLKTLVCARVVWLYPMIQPV
jgi:hypothetical protein